MVPAPRRLFAALMPGPQVREAVRQHCGLWEWPPGARLSPPERYHLTLRFLGDVELAAEERLRRELRTARAEPLELQLALPQLLGRGIAVLMPLPHEGLLALHQRVGAALAAAGVECASSSFTPHVTLARRAAGARPPSDAPPIGWAAREFALVSSVPARQGEPARYDLVETFG
jgi:2'-5' RNA ligase